MGTGAARRTMTGQAGGIRRRMSMWWSWRWRMLLRAALVALSALLAAILALGPEPAAADTVVPSTTSSSTTTPSTTSSTTVAAAATSTTTSTTVAGDSANSSSGSSRSCCNRHGRRTGWGDEFRTWSAGSGLPLGLVSSMIGSDWAEHRGADGAGVDVALIDTGVAPVPGLDGPDRVINGPDLSLDFQVGVAPGIDTFGHGTHMASIISGPEGMASQSRIVNVKAGSADGAVDVSQIIAAVDWVVQHRNDAGMNIRVLSLSGGTDSLQPYQLDPLTHAVESAWRHGIVVVVAAGNDGGNLVDPATDPYVIAVGAADTGNPFVPRDDVVASFSSVGSAERGVDLVAPGVSILGYRVPGSKIDNESQGSVVGRYLKGSGTSQAAAVTAGAVAQLLSYRPELTPDQVKAALEATADRIAGSPPSAQGAGLLDLKHALRARVSGLAGQSFPPSTGLGSIDAARGTQRLVAADGTVLAGEVDLLGVPWNASVWAPQSAAATAWDGGTWNGSTWAGGSWYPAGAPGSPLQGHTWRSEIWTGHTWRSDLWLGHTWYGHTWRDGSWD